MPDPSVVRLLSERRSKARKDHRCDCCYRPIRAGTCYSRFVFIDEEATDGGFRISRMHYYCPMELSNAS